MELRAALGTLNFSCLYDLEDAQKKELKARDVLVQLRSGDILAAST